jgi:hypothetical protein
MLLVTVFVESMAMRKYSVLTKKLQTATVAFQGHTSQVILLFGLKPK